MIGRTRRYHVSKGYYIALNLDATAVTGCPLGWILWSSTASVRLTVYVHAVYLLIILSTFC